MKKLTVSFYLAVALLASVSAASAQTTFQTFLDGSSENPPNASPGTGLGTVVLNAAQTQIAVDLSFSGLLASATASHIHGPAGPGGNAGVVFGLGGLPLATAGTIPTQFFSVSPTQVSDLFSGLLYLNLHTSVFQGGEIRGQLTLVPEPATATLLALGAALPLLARRRNRSRR